MCSHYQGIKQEEAYRKVFRVEPPAMEGKEDMWPCYQGSFIRRHLLASGLDGYGARSETSDCASWKLAAMLSGANLAEFVSPCRPDLRHGSIRLTARVGRNRYEGRLTLQNRPQAWHLQADLSRSLLSA